MIHVFKPEVAVEAVASVAATLQRGQLSEGPAVAAFEQAMATKFGFSHALATNSGTAALHLALDQLVGPGDEVVTTPQTFIATAMVPLLLGARVVFADIDLDTGNIDVDSVRPVLSDRTKAIVVVHYGGVPCEMDPLLELGVPVVEDCAHALGATYNGESVGTLGQFGAFSFQAVKQLTTGDGGLLVSAFADDHERAKRRRWFGVDRMTKAPAVEHGWKYHMNDIAATLGLGHLPRFDQDQKRRIAIDRRYRDAFASIDGLDLLRDDAEGARWIFTVLVEHRDDFVRALESRGVEAAVWHGRIDRHPVFASSESLPNAELFSLSQAIIPLRPNLTDEEVEQVIEAVKGGW